MFAFWPFDFSCSGFMFLTLLILMWITSAIGKAAKTGVNMAKKVVESETAQEVSKGFVAAWLESILKR